MPDDRSLSSILNDPVVQETLVRLAAEKASHKLGIPLEEAMEEYRSLMTNPRAWLTRTGMPAEDIEEAMTFLLSEGFTENADGSLSCRFDEPPLLRH